MGIHLFPDDPSLQRPVLSLLEWNDYLPVAWTLGISGPKVPKETISPKSPLCQ